MLAKPELPSRSLDYRIYFAALIAVVAAAVFAYYPGLVGPFVLDDFGSIARLGDYNGVRDWETFKSFVFHGTSGPTGRPLSLLTFLIDGTNWPTDAWPFKRTNLVIHLLNGGLIWLLIGKVLRVLRYDETAVRWISLVSAGCWLLHPFLVSTTLYPVQRMAQLSTLFMLCGLNMWMAGRVQLSMAPQRSYIVMTIAIAFFGLCAIFSKENGILLPVLVGTLEITAFAAARDKGSLDRRWWGAFVVVPFAVIIGYLAKRAMSSNFFEIVAPRDFSLYERLLTQSRVVTDYLYHWFFPKLYTTGVFQDHFIKSTSLLSPVATIVCTVFIITLIVLALKFRKSWPLASLAILFFFANHLLESTVINLELYFEHRNYLASAFLFVPGIAYLYKRWSMRPFAVASTGALLLLAGFTYYSSNVWSSFESIVQASAAKAPTSARAQAQYANLLFNAGHYDEGLAVLDAAIEAVPGNNALLLVNRVMARCTLGVLESGEFDRVAAILSEKPYDARMLRAYNQLAKNVVAGDCRQIELNSVLAMFQNMLNNPSNTDPDSIEFTHIKFLIGYSHLYLGQIESAMSAFGESLAARPGASYAMAMAALLVNSGYSNEALEVSDIALTQLNTKNNVGLVGQRATRQDIIDFQETVRADLQESNSARQVD